MPFTKQIAEALPSSAGQMVQCEDPEYTARAGLTKCSWNGIPPNPLGVDIPPGAEPEKYLRYKSWVTVNVTQVKNSSDPFTARFSIEARNTRACRILFEEGVRVREVNVTGFSTDARFPLALGEREGEGARSVRLWRREWEKKPWEVFVRWDGSSSSSSDSSTTPRTSKAREGGGHAELVKKKEKDRGKGKGLDGRVVCLWSDANQAEKTIPAWREVGMFAPKWSAVTKLSDGLVEGSKGFKI